MFKKTNSFIAGVAVTLVFTMMVGVATYVPMRTVAKAFGESMDEPMQLANLGFDTHYSPLSDINSDRIVEKKLDKNNIENNGIVFEKTTGYEKAVATHDFSKLLIDEKGNYLTAGQIEQADGYQDICIVKYDSNGKEINRHTYGGSDFDTVHEAKYNPQMGLVIAGISQSKDGDFANDSNSPFVACIDAQTLKIKWVYPVQIADSVYHVTDHAVFVVHNESKCYRGTGDSKPSLVKLNNQGLKVWQTEPLEQRIHSIAELNDGKIIVVQTFINNGGAITCYSKNGEKLSKMKADSYGDIAPTDDGGFMIVSVRNKKTVPQPMYISSIWYDTETVVTKYDHLFNLQWRKTYDSVKDAVGMDKVIPQSDGSIIIDVT
ncbi:hypothetical protein [Desulforamulus aeronauticus]|uniref:Arylsulfotransferase (ASST) n=1 Tax=Desulforamulus aeronauticus DSM 10349 TaxID=1121421 RepID=A0A1M6XB42_9FIRM|nr:hypothetical protein [Desulforamulus aeronauticus]SHL03005.1 hypothetical protein SAMN02745123_03962 [Desulforamulus aeronauticus DSM 10349]